MCKHCKTNDAKSAAEAGNLTDRLALALRDYLSITDQLVHILTDDDFEGTGLDVARFNGEQVLATYEESRTRNPEPPKEEPEFRYFHNGDRSFFWKLPTDGGRGYCRTSDGSWDFSSCALFDMALDYEIPNPDL